MAVSIRSDSIVVSSAGNEAWAWRSRQVTRSTSGSASGEPSSDSRDRSMVVPASSHSTNRLTRWNEVSPTTSTRSRMVRPAGQPPRISSAVNGVGARPGARTCGSRVSSAIGLLRPCRSLDGPYDAAQPGSQGLLAVSQVAQRHLFTLRADVPLPEQARRSLHHAPEDRCCCQDDAVTGCSITDFFDLADQLPEVTREDNGRYWRIQVSNQTFGYLWEPTRTVGLKQTVLEQLALVAERPETFEVQFTSGGFGWVVVRLEGVERDELAELTFEAWRLTAPDSLTDERGDRLPR